MTIRGPHDYDSKSRIKPDPEDYEAIECEYGKLSRHATTASERSGTR